MAQDPRRKLASFLKKTFTSKQQERPGFTLRALAGRLGLSHSQLSRIFSGQRGFPAERTKDFIRSLHLDSAQKAELQKLILATHPREKLAAQTGIHPGARVAGAGLEDYEILNQKNLKLLEKWHYIAILDLSTTEGFRADPQWIAARLGISAAEVVETVKLLEELGLIQLDEKKKWRKKKQRVHFPVGISLETVRNYHIQCLERAIRCLKEDTGETAYAARLITGLTVAADPGRLETAKAILNAALLEAAKALSEESGTELYQLSLQLFPLSKGKVSN